MAFSTLIVISFVISFVSSCVLPPSPLPHPTASYHACVAVWIEMDCGLLVSGFVRFQHTFVCSQEPELQIIVCLEIEKNSNAYKTVPSKRTKADTNTNNICKAP